ncbi:MAG: metal ABC transporter ATP-binding protein [Planctomycetota bacterium]|jgi:zinc transport system ATP-binding protein|nr:metal ABC transporter ATP-binding protein [Planctomycetota bacterium]
MPILQITGACFGYGGRAVLHNVNLTVEAGDYLCVVGENGSGKSTLVKGILQLLPPQPGTVRYDGVTFREVGYLAQDAAPRADFPAGVFEIVLSGRLGSRGFLPFYSRADKRLAAENLAVLGIADLRDRCFRELSGGQARRVLLARALTASQKLLILDEPAAGFDPLVSAEMHRLLKKINAELGVTIIMVSHDLSAAMDCAKHILHLKNRPLFYGAAADYRRSAVGRAFLEHQPEKCEND